MVVKEVMWVVLKLLETFSVVMDPAIGLYLTKKLQHPYGAVFLMNLVDHLDQ